MRGTEEVTNEEIHQKIGHLSASSVSMQERLTRLEKSMAVGFTALNATLAEYNKRNFELGRNPTWATTAVIGILSSSLSAALMWIVTHAK